MIFFIIVFIYYIITGPRRNIFGEVTKPTRQQMVFFYTGLALLYIIKGAPIDLLSHIMLSAHMAQMAILYMIIPVLFIKGLPVWLIESFINKKGIKPIIHFFTHPIIALGLFNSLFAIYHLPAIFDFSKSSQVAHVF